MKAAQGTASAIPCEQVFYLLSHPTIDPESRARGNRKFPGCGFARLMELSRSVDDSTLARIGVARKKLAVWRCSSSHNKPLVPTRTGEAPLLAAQRRRWMS